MLTVAEMQEVVKDIHYKDWRIRVLSDPLVERKDVFLQVVFYAPDNEGVMPGMIQQHGRKWRLSQHMTKSEIVRTAFMAVLAAEEHEAREKFRYRGRAVFGPHIDVDELYLACERLDAREEAMHG